MGKITMKITKKEKAEKEGKISKEMTFAEIVQFYPETIPILLKKGMACIGCPMAMQESLEVGARAHGLNVENLVEELNKKIEKTRKRK